MSNSSVGRLPLVRRGLLYGLIVLLLVSAGLAAFIPIQQQILRHRAEHLLADIRSLKLRESTWASVQPIFTRWGGWGHYDGECTQQSCSYEIELGDFAYNHQFLIRPPLFLQRVYRLFGGRTSLVTATVYVQDGLIWAKSFSVAVDVPPENPASNYRYMLLGSAGSLSRFRLGFLPSFADHPNYAVYTPGGCTGCQAVFAEFSPYADPADVDRLMQFDLTCLTRRRPCREKGEIMPTAWAQYLKEADLDQTVHWQQYCSTYPLVALGRDTANAAVVEVVANRIEGGTKTDYPFQVSTVRLTKKLKGTSFWNVGTTRDVRVFEGTVSHTPHRRPEDLVAGSRFIIMFAHRHSAGPSGPEVWLDSCGALPMTDQNLDKVRRGIDEDYLAERGEKPWLSLTGDYTHRPLPGAPHPRPGSQDAPQ